MNYLNKLKDCCLGLKWTKEGIVAVAHTQKESEVILMLPRSFWSNNDGLVKLVVGFQKNFSPVLLVNLSFLYSLVFCSSILELEPKTKKLKQLSTVWKNSLTQILICVSDKCKLSASSNRRPLEMYSFLLNSTSSLNVWSLLNVVLCLLCRPSLRRLRATVESLIYGLINLSCDIWTYLRVLWSGEFSHNYLITKQMISREKEGEILKFNSLHLKVNENIALSNKTIYFPINSPYGTRK